MQKLLVKKNENKQKSHRKTNISVLSLNEIEKFYSDKKNNDFLIGLEYERLSLDKNTLKNAEYEKIEKIIKHFSQIASWELVYDDKTLIGAKSSNGTSISLEPGCQLEISVRPLKNILDIDLELSKIIELLDKIAQFYDVIFLGYGVNPASNADEIPLLDKRRYKIMDEYLPGCDYGELIPKMMRQSAGIQINIDYKDKQDAYLKLKFFNLIMPFMSALCANSPFENNILSEKKTSRCHIWRFCGKNRCNFFYKDVFSKMFGVKNIFKNYINEILNVPMLFIERDNKIVEIKGKISFSQFLKNGFEGFYPQMDDYILHQSLCFPDIRLKKYIEIRNHDSSDFKTALALCAFYKGLANGDIEEHLKKIKYLKTEDVDYYASKIIYEGLDIKINSKTDGWGLIGELFNLSKENLPAKDRVYLQPFLQMFKNRKTQADIILEYNIKNTRDLVEFLT